MMSGGLIGLVASFLETLEYQEILKNAHAQLVCNLNSVFSCGNVLNAWQSKVFGFPNSMMCMVFFTTMFAVGLVGLAGGTVPRRLRLWLHGVALFFLGFAMWFMWESTFRIRALCILCLFCLSGLFMLNAAWLRLNAANLPISAHARARLERMMKSGADIFVWIVWALVIGLVMFLRFA